MRYLSDTLCQSSGGFLFACFEFISMTEVTDIMQKKIIFTIIMITSLLLGCGDNNAEASSSPSPSVNINILPVIMDVVAGVVPEIYLNNNDGILNRVCSVAYGEIKPEVFRKEINQSGRSGEKEGVFAQLMQSDDIKRYQTVCAAYMIQSAGIIPDVNQYVTQQKNAAGETVIKADENSVISLMPFRLAVARATAELYARIAAGLPEKKGQLTEIYSRKAYNLFAESSADYLETVRKYNKEEINHKYQLLLLQKGKFMFKSSTGYIVDITQEGMNLYLYGTPWLADGHILGIIYSTEVVLK